MGRQAYHGLTTRRSQQWERLQIPAVVGHPAFLKGTQMNVFNLNTLQTLLSGINAALIAMLLAIGCVTGVDGKLVCTVAGIGFLTPAMLGWAATISNFLKFIIIPAMQPGGWLNNLFAPKVPVSASGAVGTVTLKQVETGPKK